MEEYRALGLNSRGMAWALALIGLLLTPAIIGVPLLIWGAVADRMLYKHEKAMREGLTRGRNWKGPLPAVRSTSLSYEDNPSSDDLPIATAVETCDNCGRPIGKLETPHLWNDHVVCAACAETLAKQ